MITVIFIWALFIVLFVLTSQVTEFFRDVTYELFTSGQTIGDVLRSPFVRFAPRDYTGPHIRDSGNTEREEAE